MMIIDFFNYYNLTYDLGELHDLAASQPAKVKELESRLMAYLERVHAEVLYPSKNKVKKSNDDDDSDE